MVLKKAQNIFYLLLFFVFITLTTSFYFSDQNVKSTNKFRSIYSTTQKNNIQDLPLLKNDTDDIIEYRNDIEIYKKSKKKYKFWDLIEK